ncbi:mitotic checkpoint regulator, MAD2B-interacting-domain-containing protein [Crassisporium funariophilum]|nr:mitotic checkpoint regulator, MAD2B-interacting-domain-containing protein [Crassisporium funariophilum]
MLGIEDYGSDSDTPSSANPSFPATLGTTKVVAKSSKTQRVPKKITIALPSLPLAQDEGDENPEYERPAKKQKTGAGSSSLLSMLPGPKQKGVMPIREQRVLGGGSGRGLNFSTALPQDRERESYSSGRVSDIPQAEITFSESVNLVLKPTHVAKGRKNISLEETNINQPVKNQTQASTTPANDFFSLGSSKPSSSSTSKSTFLPSLPIASSAPSLPEYEPPEPTPTDEYPGYYQLPSGAWAAYDPEYYSRFMKKWQNEYNAQVRALEKGTIKGFEGLRDAPVEEIDAMKEMEKAKKEIQDREERKAITQGAAGGPVAPKMNINASKTSGVARSRHQLSTLLKEAYENREALEERIAQGKRNRKEAGNKYGF